MNRAGPVAQHLQPIERLWVVPIYTHTPVSQNKKKLARDWIYPMESPKHTVALHRCFPQNGNNIHNLLNGAIRRKAGKRDLQEMRCWWERYSWWKRNWVTVRWGRLNKATWTKVTSASALTSQSSFSNQTKRGTFCVAPVLPSPPCTCALRFG